MATYDVSLFGSNPSNNNDDCFAGKSFSSYEKALAVFNNPEKFFSEFAMEGVRFVRFEGSRSKEDEYFVRELEGNDAPSEDWEREMRAEGAWDLDSYNDGMGW